MAIEHEDFYLKKIQADNYRYLAKAVIRLAITDLRHTDKAYAAVAESFFENKEFLMLWCDVAGLDYDVVKSCSEFFLYNGEVQV
jgi:hypothetical protein